jgi:transposase
MIRGLLTVEEWAIFMPFLTTASSRGGRLPKNHRHRLDGILWICRTGARWRDSPAAFGKVNSVRSLAMRFHGLLRGHDPDVLDDWIRDALDCGIHAMQTFAAKLSYDIEAVRNAVCEPWSNGQTEGQINRLKMLKRAMY